MQAWRACVRWLGTQNLIPSMRQDWPAGSAAFAGFASLLDEAIMPAHR
jgi:hypothetical protein